MTKISEMIDSLEIEMEDLESLIVQAKEDKYQERYDALREARDKIYEAINALEEAK